MAVIGKNTKGSFYDQRQRGSKSELLSRVDFHWNQDDIKIQSNLPLLLSDLYRRARGKSRIKGSKKIIHRIQFTANMENHNQK
ncbi:hypothetical protein VNO78_07562 [Psophocarpus tetragonolobus]|uniref:Uncharacterized protein n=1 Tax=Psophocarpus tetragonolobus TaxID=3891 RepID=A0AAN9SWD0_PSOTE